MANRRSLVDSVDAPPAAAFATFPPSWYLFGSSSELSRGPVAKTMLGRQIVAFRTASGQLAVMDGQCSHLGADLGSGTVEGECIRCPFHSWTYGIDGHCVRLPDGSRPPAFARQRVYPAEERHGFVFFFLGPKALFPLPFFADQRPDDFVAARPFNFMARCSWSMVAAHAFDVQHFQSVHDRRLLAPPVIDDPHPFSRRTKYTAIVEGHSIFDRMLRIFVNRQATITITTWAGTMFLMTGDFGKVCSRFIIMSEPIDDVTTKMYGIVYSPRGRNPLTRAVQPLALWVRRLFTHGYLADESRKLGMPRYQASHLVDCDREMITYFNWVVSLPQDVAEAAPAARDVPADAPHPELCSTPA